MCRKGGCRVQKWLTQVLSYVDCELTHRAFGGNIVSVVIM